MSCALTHGCCHSSVSSFPLYLSLLLNIRRGKWQKLKRHFRGVCDIYDIYDIYFVNLLHVTIFIIYPYDDSSIMHPFFVVGEIASSALRGHDKIPLRANRRHSRSLPPSPVVSSLTGLPEYHCLAPVSMSHRSSVILSVHFNPYQSIVRGASQ